MPRSILCPFCDEFIEDAAGFGTGRVTCPACAEVISLAQVEQQTPEWVAARRLELEKQGRVQRPRPATGQPTGAAFVTDVVLGPNLRWKDNVFQAVAIFVSLLIGASIGPLVADEVAPGVLVGAFIGLVVGLFGSGIALMIYRMFRH
jgi:uncharacterized membrane protein YeaQ/YmgE (transglycosylase-associated protein family)